MGRDGDLDLQDTPVPGIERPEESQGLGGQWSIEAEPIATRGHEAPERVSQLGQPSGDEPCHPAGETGPSLPASGDDVRLARRDRQDQLWDALEWMPAVSPRDRDDLALRPPECLDEAALVAGLDADALAPGAKTRRQAGRVPRLLRADENDGDVGFDGASLKNDRSIGSRSAKADGLRSRG